MDISFPLKSAYDFDYSSVAFPAVVSGTQIRCLVSEEALQDNFNGAGALPVEVFEANREVIQQIAAQKIREGAQGTLILRSKDF